MVDGHVIRHGQEQPVLLDDVLRVGGRAGLGARELERGYSVLAVDVVARDAEVALAAGVLRHDDDAVADLDRARAADLDYLARRLVPERVLGVAGAVGVVLGAHGRGEYLHDRELVAGVRLRLLDDGALALARDLDRLHGALPRSRGLCL